MAGFHGSNEVIFHNGVDLTGEQAPTLIRCGSQATLGKLLALLADRGITHLGGRPATDVIKPQILNRRCNVMATATSPWAAEHAAHFARLLLGGDRRTERRRRARGLRARRPHRLPRPPRRHWRLDPDSTPERICVWIRSVTGGYVPRARAYPVTRPAFDVDQARRRNLAFTACRRGGDTLVFDLEVGQRAVVRPIQSEHLPELQRWGQLVLPPSVP